MGILGLENYIQVTSLISKRNLISKFTFINTTCYKIQSLHILLMFLSCNQMQPVRQCHCLVESMDYICCLNLVLPIVWIFISLEVYSRADEWDVNKWTWEGTLKVISKGEECIIRLEDKTTGQIISESLRCRKWYIVSLFDELCCVSYALI